jgi:gluconate 2-dehydrogenase gamma chain
MPTTITRREFLLQSALYSSAAWALINVPRPNALAAAVASTAPVTFSPAEWKLVEAISGRIIPTDDEPGAIEANVVNFIDKALANEEKALLPVYKAGLPGIDAVAQARFKKKLVDLTPAEQDEVLAALDGGKAAGWPKPAVPSGQFLTILTAHTVYGFCCDPSYGGNRDYAGWKVVGYPGRQHHRGGYTKDQMLGKEPIVPIWKS